MIKKNGEEEMEREDRQRKGIREHNQLFRSFANKLK